MRAFKTFYTLPATLLFRRGENRSESRTERSSGIFSDYTTVDYSLIESGTSTSGPESVISTITKPPLTIGPRYTNS